MCGAANGENLRFGFELYDGLGTRHQFGPRDTSHYLAPTIAWQMPSGVTLAVSPGFGLNGNRQFGRGSAR